jgi:hypothetical protein
LILAESLRFQVRNPDVVAALLGVVQVRSPLGRVFAGAAFVVGEDSGVIAGVVLPV